MYTDPSGEIFFVPILLAVAVAVTVNAINNIINGVPFWYGAGKAGVMGAVGAISFAIGGPMLAPLYNSAIGMLINGGDIKSFGLDLLNGYISAGISAIPGAAEITNPATLKALSIVTGALSGGISSTIAGGNFGKGFGQGVIS